MSKKDQGGKAAEEQQVATPEAPATETTNNGTVVLKAKTSDEIATKFAELKAFTKEATFSTGAVGQQDDGTYILLVNIKPTKK